MIKGLSQTDDYWYLTPTNYSMYKMMKNYLGDKKYQRVLDLGAGSLAFKQLVNEYVQEYVALDIQKDSSIDLVGNGANLPIKGSIFDLVICSAVLEHAQRPDRIIKEIYRVLEPSGEAILTVPHIHYIHGEPYDYWRFTKYGIKNLLDISGFNHSKLEISEVGSFINMMVSCLIPPVAGLLDTITPRKFLLKILRFTSIMFEMIDRYIRFEKFPLGYIAFIQKGTLLFGNTSNSFKPVDKNLKRVLPT